MKILIAYLDSYISLPIIQGDKPLLQGITLSKNPTSKDINAFLQKLPDVDSP